MRGKRGARSQKIFAFITRFKRGYWKGIFAEWIAAWILRLKGYRVLHKRYKNKCGEIDLIVQRRGVLAFVEVKYRPSIRDGFEAIQMTQRRRIENASQIYLTSCTMKSFQIRFDAIVVSGYGIVTHMENAWRSGD